MSLTFKALATVFALVFGGSAIVVLLLGFVARTPGSATRSAFVSFYLLAAALNGAFAALGFLPAYIALRWRASELSRRRQLLWPFVSGLISTLLLNLGLTTKLVGRSFGRLLPPAHFGMVDLFASVAAVSFVVTLVLKVVDTYVRMTEQRNRIRYF